MTVNGIPALVIGTQFSAYHVPLEEGVNTITVAATDTAGMTVSITIAVTAATSGKYITLTPDIGSDISPLEVTLRVGSSFGFTSSTISASGPGSVELLSSATDEYRMKMTIEGTYTFTASVTDTDGTVYQDTVSVTVLNRDYLDRLLKTKWEGMKTAEIDFDCDSTPLSPLDFAVARAAFFRA